MNNASITEQPQPMEHLPATIPARLFLPYTASVTLTTSISMAWATEQPQSFQSVFYAHVLPSETKDDPISILYCYGSEDESYYQILEKHLSILKYQNVITSWNPHHIHTGEERRSEINTAIQKADIALLLISPDFMASTQLYAEQVKPILSQRKAGNINVIAIIVRPTEGWEDSEFSRFLVQPRRGKSIDVWQDPNSAFAAIAQDIQSVVERLRGKMIYDRHSYILYFNAVATY